MCEALGPVEGNKVLRSHWDNWLTEDHIIGLKKRGIEIVRLPIGDWTLNQYGPYVGCTDGAAEKIEWALDMFAKYDIKVLLDVHAWKDSQNGFDNSGKASNLEWFDETHFQHWPIQTASWMGHWDGEKYDTINWDNIKLGLKTVQGLMERYGHHPAVYAFEPMNEPWWTNDLDILKQWYRDAREIVRSVNPNTIFVFHESFRRDAALWNDLFPDDDMENVVLDTHPYMAFWTGDLVFETAEEYCAEYKAQLTDEKTSKIKYPMWAGEWSLGTDVCTFWLNGFNDYRDPYSYPCSWVECPKSYMPEPYGVDFDRSAAKLGPFGVSPAQTPEYGMCNADSDHFGYEDVQKLANCHLEVFNETMQAQFMWTFRTEVGHRWSYAESYD